MIDELNEYLESDILEDRWYYDVIFTCENIINDFLDADWEDLKVVIPTKDERWRRRLSECLEEIHTPNAEACKAALEANRK